VTTNTDHLRVVVAKYSWRAAEHLCQFVIDRPEFFRGKTMCELGAGLGLVAVLIEKLGYTEGGLLVATDGDEPTMSLLIDNKVDNECFFESSYLYWGETEDFLSSYPDKFEVVIAADVIYEEEQIEPLLDTVRAVMRRKCSVCAYNF
jgi:predicted nicotinamide N-methyase